MYFLAGTSRIWCGKIAAFVLRLLACLYGRSFPEKLFAVYYHSADEVAGIQNVTFPNLPTAIISNLEVSVVSFTELFCLESSNPRLVSFSSES